ncbi:hypothetical protein C8A01DRAFT_41873 [Parachaetomium inaequale]|uniref:Rhodopsin domain-containing protein n=1 Tax=Parachaetomium inaequale TaxID=2588326 RepID=A0AAN6SLG2_9PEZI|nr:hypothetical protein C8A01DRAFT_41873 [Parachaetomium inaequale]
MPAPGAGLPDENKGPEILGASVTVTTIALITVIVRLVVRSRIVRKLGTDDYAMVIAMLLSLGGLAVIIGQVLYGAGRHAAYLDPQVNSLGLKWNFAGQVIYMWALPAVKMSVGFCLLRIAPNKTYRRILQGVMIFTMAYTFVCFMTLLLQCRNLAVLWDLTIETTCWPVSTLQGLSYASCAVNIFTDLFFAVLPIPMLWNVQINARTRYTLICIMSLGIFACAAGMVKSAYISNYGKTGDFLWDSANLTIWYSVECNVGIVAASLPCLKPLFKRILETSLGYGSSRKKDSYKLRDQSHGSARRGSKHLDSRSPRQAKARNLVNISTLGGNTSEESILSQQQPHAITKTTVVTIDRAKSDTGHGGSEWPAIGFRGQRFDDRLQTTSEDR